MPCKANPPIPATPKQSVWDPDVRPDDVFTGTYATFSQEPNDGIPENFDQLTPEQQAEIVARLRAQGTRLRPDIKDKKVPLTRETLDVP